MDDKWKERLTEFIKETFGKEIYNYQKDELMKFIENERKDAFAEGYNSAAESVDR